ncbi:hypothetical protein PRK78_007484 [Emydomyces testavorans]|uniref:LysM domain-containing protein n=1 Tax=Emydomyces testavorans TaxID=2070801 RepID=A0AAF0DPB8_9EURO|nr:hypothetical protein PRK78_007484 [Emydomyces testavorans]
MWEVLTYDIKSAVGNTCSALWANYYICVGVSGTPTTSTSPATPTTKHPSPTQSGIIDSCTQFYKAVTGDTCDIIANEKFKTFTVAQFIQWNPAVGTDCSKLFLGFYYCVAIPGTPTKHISSSPTPTSSKPQPQQPGTIETCNKFHLVASDDTCFSIEQKYAVSDSDFHSWNPGVGADCSKLWLGYYVCVGIPGASATPT